VPNKGQIIHLNWDLEPGINIRLICTARINVN
jgi:hypothetical protein